MFNMLFIGFGLGIFAAALLLSVARDLAGNQNWKR